MGTRAGLAYPEGNPGALSAASGRLSDLAARIERASASIAEGTRLSGWKGHRFGVFIAAGRALGNVLEPGASALRRASSDLDGLATQVKDAQRRIEDWADEIEAAQRRLKAAGTALHSLMFSNPLLGGANATSPAGANPNPALGRAQTAFTKAGNELDELRAQYEPKAKQLCDRIKQEDERTASSLQAAAGAAPQAAAAPTAASPGPAPKSGGSDPLTFFDFDKDAEAGWGNEDGAVGPHASASLAAILAHLHTEYDDGASTTEIDGTVGVGADGEARAEVGPKGVHAGLGGEAHAGGKVTATTTLGDDSTFALKPSVDGRLGPGAEAKVDFDAGADGIHFGAHAGLSAIVGGGVHVEVNINPQGLFDEAMKAPREIEKLKDMFDF
jgi:hypothetical protein